MASSTTGSDNMSLHAPRHPVPQLQGPFEESMVESITETVDRTRLDPMARRTMLLEGPTYERVCAGRWKQKAGERFHPLWKITAQMSFGIHLLAEGLAKSEDDVIAILQTHVDDVDGFLESTTEDFDLAQSDVADRLRYLQLPLEHGEVFDRMLEDRPFRMSIVEGNQKIEHVVARTSEATKDALKDVQKGLQATDALGKYLQKVELGWTNRSPDHDAVFAAMVGNVEGWHRAFDDLYHQGVQLGLSLVQLATIVSEMQRRAGVASRKTLLQQRAHGYSPLRSPVSPPRRIGNGDYFAVNSSGVDLRWPQGPSKPLPSAPGISPSSRRLTGRTSLRDRRPTQPTGVSVENQIASNTTESRGQAAQRAVSGDSAKRLKNQASAPDLKLKAETFNAPDISSVSQLASLGLGAGLGLGQIKETKSSRPVIVQRPSTDAERGNSDPHLQSSLKSPKEHLIRGFNVSVHDHAPQQKRLSFSLGSRNKDRPTDGQPYPGSPKASGTLLKSALSPRAGASTGLANGPANAKSPTRPASRRSPDNSSSNTLLNSSPRVVGQSPGQGTSPSTGILKPSRKYNANNPTFTSHPPDMDLAISRSVKQGETPELSAASLTVPSLRAVPDLDSGHTSYESSLGEPGPEISATDEVDVTAQGTPVAELDSGVPVRLGPIELEAVVPAPSQPVAFELEASPPLQPMPTQTGTSMMHQTSALGATIDSHSDFFKLPPQQMGELASDAVDAESKLTQTTPTFISQDRSQNTLLRRSFQLPSGSQSNVSRLLPQETDTSSDEASHRSCQPPPEGQHNAISAAITEDGDLRNHLHESSVELPADSSSEPVHLNPAIDESKKAVQHRSFQLPPDGQAKDSTTMPPEQSENRKIMNHRSFQLPSLSQREAGGANVDQAESNGEDASSRGDMATRLSRINTSEVIIKSKRSNPQHRLSLIEIISHTPPGSPIHERLTSSASFPSAANSACLTSYRASIDLAPPEEAPALPGPGGRGMVTPDYAAAGAFEGEKKAKRASGASMSGLKKIFSGGSANHSRASSVRVVQLAEGKTSDGGVHEHVDLMTPGGSDVLWFKGLGRDGVWVSGN